MHDETSTHRPHRTTRRALSAVCATALAAGLGVVTAAPAHAAGNTLSIGPTGSDHASYAGNGVVVIDGSITFEDDCRGMGSPNGSPDWIYPATDVYLVPTGSVALWSTLKDASGGEPNTIVGTSGGAFLGEIIAVTTPSGTLGDGEYDIVYDTCQDGVLDRADEIFSEAVLVDVPDGEVPPVDPSLRRLKDAAREEYATWLKMHIGLTALFKLEDAKSIATCLLAPSLDCLFEVLTIIYDLDTARAKGEDWLEGVVLGEIMNTAKHYGAIWQDPADPAFTTLPRATAPDTREVPAAGHPVGDALAGLAGPLAREGALSEELLHALERYQGAQEAGDGEWALVQARAVSDVAATLGDQLAASDAVADLTSTMTARADQLVAEAEKGEAVAARIRREGLTPEEKRAMADRGLSRAQVAGIERGFVEQGRLYAPTASDLRADLAAVGEARRELRDALAATVEGWDAHVEALEKQVEDLHPTADAGGPYTTAADGAVRLSAAASHAGRDGAKLADASWDLDGDGQYDDATGFETDARLDRTTTVAVRVTDGAGRSAVGLAEVVRAAGDRAPVVTASSPANATSLRLGEQRTFTVQASDPDGDTLRHEWTYRGQVVPGATGPSYTLAPQASEAGAVGAGVLSVRVLGRERSTAHSWVVTVTGPDADGDGWTGDAGANPGPDCDDARADRHPTALERVGNGIDDDCDPATPDAPVGGLGGSVVAWGSSPGVGLPARTPSDTPYWSPVPVPSLGSDVRVAEQVDRAGFAAVGPEGRAWSWGKSFNGRLGDGQEVDRWSPVPVLGVGGGAGTQLGGVLEFAGQWNWTLARLTNGTVAAWGSNLNKTLGTNDAASERHVPQLVVDSTGRTVDDVVQVDTGENTSYAVTSDGRVRNWGTVHCDDDLTTTTTVGTGEVNPLLGTGVVQVASGDGGGALLRRADGSVWSCGGYENTLGRDYTNDDKAELRPVKGLSRGVVDLSMGSSTAMALDEEGRVWMWGRNTNHELDVLGLPAGATQKYPALVPLPAGPPVVAIDGDESTSSFAVRADGTVLTWGANTYGSAGVGTSAITLTPPLQQTLAGPRTVLGLSNAGWNGLAVVRPATDPEMQPAAQWIGASLADATIDEGAGGTAALTLTDAAPSDLLVRYRVGDAAVHEATVPAGARGLALPVSVTDDQVDEDDEQVAVELLSVSRSLRLDRPTAVLTVRDDDAAPSVSVGSATLPEGDTSLTDVTLPVRLSKVSGKDVQVTWTAREGASETAHGVALLPAGTTSVEVHVPAAGDRVPDRDRVVDVVLSDPVNAGLGGDGRVTLTDDDPVRVLVSAPRTTEGDSATTPAAYVVEAPDLPAGERLTLPWQVVGGTAELGADVLDESGTLTLDGDGQRRGEAVTHVVGDRRAEPLAEEVYGLRLGTSGSPLRTSTGRPVLVTEVPRAVVADQDSGPAVDAGVPVQLDEGGSVQVTGHADAPAVWSVTGAGCSLADPKALTTTLACRQDGDAVLTLTADDGVNDPASAAVAVTVRNAAPKVSITSPAAGTKVTVGQAVTVVARATDAGPDDTVTCTVDWGDGSPVEPLTGCQGTHAFAAAGSPVVTVRASDGTATSSATVGLQVGAQTPGPAYPFDGFYAPVDNPSVVNVVKAGSVVPVKFSLGGNRGLDIFKPGFPASSAHSCSGSVPLDDLEQTASPGAATLTYDATSGRYHYNWQTAKGWAGTCRTLKVTLVDGRTRTAEFRFR